MKARGVKELNKHLSGGKLSLKQSIIAKCADCLGLYADGKIDCAMPDCPLYPWMPYGSAYRNRVKKVVSSATLKALHQKRGNI